MPGSGARPAIPLHEATGATTEGSLVSLTTRGDAPSRERRLVETFVELADTLVEDVDVVEFFSTLTGRVVQLGIASETGILLVDETGDLQYIAASDERTHLLELLQVQNQQGPCQDCFATGAPVHVSDLKAASDRWPQFAPRAVLAGFRSVQAVPLRLRGAVLGAFGLFLTDPVASSRPRASSRSGWVSRWTRPSRCCAATPATTAGSSTMWLEMSSGVCWLPATWPERCSSRPPVCDGSHRPGQGGEVS